jgi:hypothetical protein
LVLTRPSPNALPAKALKLLVGCDG